MKPDKPNTKATFEADLLEIIQRHLSPTERERFDYLLEKNEVDELTKAEQKEFLAYADQIESQGGERARALVELAQLRNVNPIILIDEFLP